MHCISREKAVWLSAWRTSAPFWAILQPFFFAMVVPLSGLMYVFLARRWPLYFLGMCALISITGDNIVKGLLRRFRFIVSMVGATDQFDSTLRLYLLSACGMDIVPVTLAFSR